MVKRKGSSVIILIFSIMAIAGLSSFALDLGLILNQRYELQKAVESAALISASEYEPYENGANYTVPTQANIDANADDNYEALRDKNQLLTGIAANSAITIDPTSRAVVVNADTEVNTYFINIVGISKIEIKAEAAAINMPAFLSPVFPKPTGSILMGTGAYLDTEIKQPLGSVATNTTDILNRNADIDNIYGIPDGRTVSMGPGGYVTIKLPTTLVDGKGIDFAIYERGHAEGYFVYAGIDTDPSNPYINASTPGGGLSWVNVSCTGIPLNVNKNGIIGAHVTNVTLNGANLLTHKFYGSGLFDLGATCTDSGGTAVYNTGAAKISNVKYLKIIDDNREDGFYLQPRLGIGSPSAIPTLIPGEHSTFTPGIDLDAVEIYHHSRLVRITDVTGGDDDPDGDGLAAIAEQMYGLDPANADTDGDGVNDGLEVWGYNPASMTSLQGSATGVLFKDYPTEPQVPPEFEVFAP